jgi:hypothetical protein
MLHTIFEEEVTAMLFVLFLQRFNHFEINHHCQELLRNRSNRPLLEK